MVPRGDGSFMRIKCWYTPTLPVTVISLGEHVQQNPTKLYSHTIFLHKFKGSGEVRFHDTNGDTEDIFLTQYFRKKSVTHGLIPSTHLDNNTEQVNALNEEGQRFLWHQQMRHLHFRGI